MIEKNDGNGLEIVFLQIMDSGMDDALLYVLLCQLQLKVVGNLSGDERMLKLYSNIIDAAESLHVDLSEPLPE
jgi:hypothetical protein